MVYFWNENHRVYYFRVSKKGRKIYNFDDPAEFGDEAAETHMVDDQPIGASHGVPQGDMFMQDDDHEDGQGTDLALNMTISLLSSLCFKICRLGKMSAIRRIIE